MIQIKTAGLTGKEFEKAVQKLRRKLDGSGVLRELKWQRLPKKSERRKAKQDWSRKKRRNREARYNGKRR